MYMQTCVLTKYNICSNMICMLMYLHLYTYCFDNARKNKVPSLCPVHEQQTSCYRNTTMVDEESRCARTWASHSFISTLSVQELAAKGCYTYNQP